MLEMARARSVTDIAHHPVSAQVNVASNDSAELIKE